MTTAATDGKSMACDGQASACGTIISTAREKIVLLNDGSLFGFSGRGAEGIAMAKWLNGSDGPQPKLKNFSAMRLYLDGKLEYWGDDSAEPVPASVPCAIGSGMDFAIGAMLHGATPEEAVIIAAQRDPNTGGEISVWELEEER